MRLSHESSKRIQLWMCLAILGSSAAIANAQSSGLPTLAQVEGLKYDKSDVKSDVGVLSYDELKNLLSIATAYSRGSAILPGYREPISTRGNSGVAIYKAISPSVVLVLTGQVKDDKLTDIGIGTGVVVATGGYILTNWHVIAGYDGAAIFLKPTGNKTADDTAYGAKVIAQDITTDLALLKLVKPNPDLQPVKLGDIGSVQVAEDIHIIGHPHGHPWSYSTGVVSQIRDTYNWQYEDKSQHSAKVLQMQTAINPGNSGGPVLDDNGNILGLVAMSEEGQNLDYAIAVDVIRGFVVRALSSSGTRGMVPAKPAPQSGSYSARTPEGLLVEKTAFADLSRYVIRDAGGKPVEEIATFSDKSGVVATNPNDFGGYRDMSVSLPNGTKVVAHSNGGNGPEIVENAK
jgi:S1-C subfamily serine protease